MSLIVLKGDDDTLTAQVLKTVVDDLVGDSDRSLAVEEVNELDYGEAGQSPTIGPLVMASMTPPLLSPRRTVIGRQLGLFSKADQWSQLIDALPQLDPAVDLVLVWEKGSGSQRLPAIPKKLKEALKKAGADFRETSPTGKAKKTAFQERLSSADVDLTAAAQTLIADFYGDGLGRLNSLVEMLEATFGAGTRLDSDDVKPFLGDKSDVPPWELTDAIDSGNIVVALEKASRMTGKGGRHPLQILATLHSHYQRCLGLDGANVTNERDAAAVLGMTGSTFPAKKALSLTRRLGSQKISEAIKLLASADLDLRGASGLPAEIVVEVLIARLARLSSQTTRRAA